MVEMVEMFGVCPKCHVQYLIVYSNGSKVCTYCGHSEQSTLKTILASNCEKEGKQ